MFYEEWSKYSNKQVITPLNLAVATAKIEDNEIGQLQIPNSNTFLSTYKSAKEMSEELRRALPDVNELRKVLKNETIE